MKIDIRIIIIIGLLFFAYLVGVFVKVDFNPFLWGEDSRIITVTSWILLSCFVLIIFNFDKKTKDLE